MKHILALLVIITCSTSLMAQQNSQKAYLEQWETFKKENAPFNKEYHKHFNFETPMLSRSVQLGNLKYKSKDYSIGHDFLSVAFMLAEVVKQHSLSKDYGSE